MEDRRLELNVTTFSVVITPVSPGMTETFLFNGECVARGYFLPLTLWQNIQSNNCLKQSLSLTQDFTSSSVLSPNTVLSNQKYCNLKKKRKWNSLLLDKVYVCTFLTSKPFLVCSQRLWIKTYLIFILNLSHFRISWLHFHMFPPA